MKLFRKEEGFTLVELMVVVLIIGILVAIAIPVFNAASKSARLRTCQANQRTIEGSVQQYLAAALDPTGCRASSTDPSPPGSARAQSSFLLTSRTPKCKGRKTGSRIQCE